MAEAYASLPELIAVGVEALRTGDLPRAIEVLTRVVQQAPTEHASRLYLGMALERSGERHRATLQFARALNEAQARGRWVNADTTPAPLRPIVERAVALVRSGSRAAFMKVLEPLAQKFGRDALKRVEQCLRIYLREERAVVTDARQQPSFLFFPGLGASAYLDRSKCRLDRGARSRHGCDPRGAHASAARFRRTRERIRQ